MTPHVDHAAVARFGALLGRTLGFLLDDGKAPQLSELLGERVPATRSESVDAYLAQLSLAGPADPDVRALAERLTVTETYFLRNIEQFRALTDIALPARMMAQASTRTLRILSAGCASGEEAYSIAIAIGAALRDPSWSVIIAGIDVNAAALAKATSGRYTPWSLREMPDGVRERHFRQDGRAYVLTPELRGAVSFSCRNLLEDDASFWRTGAYDIVFCRNVLMYFRPEVVRAVVGRIAGALAPGGYLFLGHAETLRGVSQEFHLCHSHETFYYRRREAGERASGLAPLHGERSAEAFEPLASTLDGSATWVDAIQQASERIASLAARSPRATLPAAPRPAAGPHPELGAAIELLRQERFPDALERLGELPASELADPDALLLRAVLLTNCGDLRAAEEACARLLAQDDLDAGAHYVMALAREHAGDRRRAAEHDRSAAHLDPSFAMPHLHLGLMARRTGDVEVARRELEQALVLLTMEDGSRILLFGGGFTREALVQLCRAELRACGGRP